MTALQWWEIAKLIGAGGAFVLGIACLFLARWYREEQAYARTRDKETMAVLSTLTSVIKEGDTLDKRSSEGLQVELHALRVSVDTLKDTVINHALKGK